MVVGKRALPALAVTGQDVGAQLRVRSKPGDALLFMGSPVGDLMERAERWGLLTVWLGPQSDGPGPAGTDHVISGDDPMGFHGATWILAYHLLWELTHVCLEHPGLLSRPDSDPEVCITCSDEGRPGEVVSCKTDRAVVRSDRGMEEVDVTLVGPVEAGSTVLVHAGVAIAGWPEARN